MRAKTKSSEQAWKSPDGSRIIWNVVLEADGKEYPLKTFSEKISQVGFEGDIESYTTQRGEQFVKQVPKPQGGYGGGKGGNNYQPRDDAAIRAQWAIGQSIALLSATMDKKAITLAVIVDYAKQLFDAVATVKGQPDSAAVRQAGSQHIDRMAGDAA